MKKVVFGLFVLSVLHTSTNAQVKPAAKPATKPATKPAAKPVATTAQLKNRTDSVSYAIGILDGSFFKSQGLEKVNGTALSKGFQDALSGKPFLTPEQCNEIVRTEMEKMKTAKVQPTIEEGKAFLAGNRKKTGMQETASGLQYEVITMGTGAKPKDTSSVKVHYDGFLLNGQKFDSSRDRGEPIVFKLQEVIKGWTEGVQLMPIGSRFKFYIPYNLGWGIQGNGQTIPPGALTIFDIELIDIVNNSQ
jgi:FKBP-type peptidyl-prolyl cis-trans isomerase